jgi:hypothetical protein
VEDEEQAALIPVKQRMDRQYSMLSVRADLKRRTCRFLEPNVPIEMSGYLEWLKKELIAEHRDGGTQLLQALEVENKGHSMNLVHRLEQAIGVVPVDSTGPGLGAPCA